jgi:hypothetical protein
MHACLLVIGDDVAKQLEPFMDPAAFESSVGSEDSPRSPDAKYDFYIIGGKWKHLLELKSPRKVPGLFGLFTKGIDKTHTALKSEIREDALLSHPPVSLLNAGVWEDAKFAIGKPSDDDWRRHFEQMFRSLPDSARLTIVDYHARA